MATGCLALLVTFCWLEAVRSNQKTGAVQPSQPSRGSVGALVNGKKNLAGGSLKIFALGVKSVIDFGAKI